MNGYMKCGIHIQGNIIQPCKRNEVRIYATPWWNLEYIMLSEIARQNRSHLFYLYDST